MKIILAGVIENLSTRQDGSVKISFSTQELDSSQGGQLFQLRNKYVKAFFSDSEITELEANIIDAEKIVGTRNKSQSQRLRGALYVLWEQMGLQIDFEDFYRTEMERFIDSVKMKLSPVNAE